MFQASLTHESKQAEALLKKGQNWCGGASSKPTLFVKMMQAESGLRRGCVRRYGLGLLQKSSLPRLECLHKFTGRHVWVYHVAHAK